MKLSYLLPSLSFVLALAALEAADTTPRTERSSGEYRVARLELSEGLRLGDDDERSPQVLHLAFRDGKLANWWFIDHGWHAVQQHAESVRLTDKGVHGELNLRAYDGRGRLQNAASLAFVVAQSGEILQGKVDLELTGGKKQTWGAIARGSFLKPADAFEPTANWPSFAGPMGTLQASPNGPDLVDDLATSKPLWRSESFVPVSYGNAADDRYATRAAGCRAGGGSSAPVYADGVVYLGFYVPNRSVETDWSKIHESRRTKYSGEGIKKLIAELKLIDAEIKAIEDHWRPLADEVMVAMDARTGATLWRTSWPVRAYNLQTHKHRGTFGVPLVAVGHEVPPTAKRWMTSSPLR